MERWSAEKRLPNRSLVYENLIIEQEEILLSEIAYHNFLADRLFLEKREVVKQIKNHLKQNLNAPQHLDGEKVLKTIEIEQGILVERARDVYSFSHLTLQEYLTAQYIYDNDLIEEVVKNYVTETRWKEIFLLIAGLMRGKADKLLLAMEQEAHNYLKTPLGQKLVPILQWADEMTKDSPDSPIKPVGRRAIAYAYAYTIFYSTADANTKAIANNYANVITDTQAIAKAIADANTKDIADTYAFVYEKAIANTHVKAIVHAIVITIEELVKLADLFAHNRIFYSINTLELVADLKTLKQFIIKNKATQKERQEFTKKLLKIWNEAFALTPELLSLSVEEIKEIDEHYFYINHLILDCREVVPSLPPTVWQEIEDRMLRVP